MQSATVLDPRRPVPQALREARPDLLFKVMLNANLSDPERSFAVVGSVAAVVQKDSTANLLKATLREGKAIDAAVSMVNQAARESNAAAKAITEKRLIEVRRAQEQLQRAGETEAIEAENQQKIRALLAHR